MRVFAVEDQADRRIERIAAGARRHRVEGRRRRRGCGGRSLLRFQLFDLGARRLQRGHRFGGLLPHRLGIGFERLDARIHFGQRCRSGRGVLGARQRRRAGGEHAARKEQRFHGNLGSDGTASAGRRIACVRTAAARPFEERLHPAEGRARHHTLRACVPTAGTYGARQTIGGRNGAPAWWTSRGMGATPGMAWRTGATSGISSGATVSATPAKAT